MMFVAFYSPVSLYYYLQPIAQMYRMLDSMKHSNVCVIGPEHYFSGYDNLPEQHHKRLKLSEKTIGFPKLIKKEFDKFEKSIFPYELEKLFAEKYLYENISYNRLQCDLNRDLSNWLEKCVMRLHEKYPIEAFLSWRDCPSLHHIADKIGVKVIYNELGPFRHPLHHKTFILDFQGIKRSNEIFQRFESVRNNKILKRKYEERALQFFPELYNIPRGRCRAVLLACEQDFAFMNDFSNYRIIEYARELSPQKKIIARPHPFSKDVLYKNVEYDDSPNLDVIVNSCDSVVTAFSNGAIELLVKGLKVKIVGETPLRFLSEENLSEDDKAWKMGFYALNYIIPDDCLFMPDYCRWRLSMPSELEIMERHDSIWLEKVKTSPEKRVFNHST